MTDSMRVATARYVLGDITPESLPAVALQEVLRGVDSTSLAALAGAVPADSPSELRELFESALSELGVHLPSRIQAAWLLRYEYARRVVDGELAAPHGAAEIVDVFRQVDAELPPGGYVGESFGIAQIVGAYYSLSDIPQDDARALAELEDSIRESCARIVAEGPPVGAAETGAV